ncbi:hypothetical protein ACFSJY_01615 [Thalassotalea euphylliae]|uniref:hypothetical protein n=1 Tax=Thalassotalea euphylliae TaxID=1655234 RepID=UPI00362E2B14
MKQGSINYVFISVLIHGVLIVGLIINAPKLPSHVEHIPSIKSYLYSPPMATEAAKLENELNQVEPDILPYEVENEHLEKTEHEQDKAAINNVADTSLSYATKEAQPAESIDNLPSNIQTDAKQILTNKNNQQKVINPLQQLESIRSKINSSIVQSETESFTQHRSLSGMHPNPPAVPHSVVPLTQEQQKAKNTTQYGGKNIVKGDDGTCLLEEDLTSVGIEGVKAVSSFNCGESKFDASFRRHMEKVRKKIGK